MNKLTKILRKFKPPLLLSGILAALFGTASIFFAADDFSNRVLQIVAYGVYIGAAVFCTLFVWSIVLLYRQGSLQNRIQKLLHRSKITEQLVDDYSFRTVTFAYGSFGMNALFAVSKGIAGWVSSSAWLITFAAYYLILCIAKLLLLKTSKKIRNINDKSERMVQEWKAYRVCGIMLMLLTIVMQGAVVMIMKKGNSFSYYEILILVVAMYDFYCLISSVVYMVRTRKKHSPIIVAIKSISFTTSLVSMLSLQTAMFAAYGEKSGNNMQNIMNLLTGTVVCLILLVLGLIMQIQANKKIKLLQKEAVQ